MAWTKPRDESLLGDSACAISERWLLDPVLANRLQGTAFQFKEETGRELFIISGYRTAEEQAALAAKGRPAAPDYLSTHRSCPATGADVWAGPVPNNPLKATLGRIAIERGLRWGGGGPVSDIGIPIDWNHFDLGPRTR